MLALFAVLLLVEVVEGEVKLWDLNRLVG